jgi:hypothetical protein
MHRVTTRLVLISALVAAAAAGTAAACSPPGDPGSGGSACPDLSTTCPSVPPSWHDEVQPLVLQYCDRCHGAGGVGQPLFDDTSYATVYRGRTAMELWDYNCQMPPSDASPPAAMPTPDERQKLVSWVVCGAPNN